MLKNQLHDVIQKRRSPVIFSDKLIEEAKIDLMFEAARWAPSSMNEQPWRFIYASRDNTKSFKKLFDCLLEGNKPWNESVPLLILAIEKNNFDYKNRPNIYAKYDVASAVANLTFQANFMNLWVHQMAGFDAEIAKNTFNVPEGFKPLIMLSVGYLGDVYSADENLKKRDREKRKRKPLNELVFRNTLEKNGSLRLRSDQS